MKRILSFGLLLTALFAACTSGAEQPVASQERGVTITVYRAPT